MTRMTEVQTGLSPGDEVADALNAIDDGDLLVFPPGRFSWTSEVRVTADNWGISCQQDTVFEVPVGVGDGEEYELLATSHGSQVADNFLLENLTFDSEGRSAPALHLGVRNRARVNGLQYEMNGPLSDQSQENGLRAYATDPDGTIRIDDYRQFNNGNLGGYGEGNSRIGVWVGPSNNGTVHLRNPVLQGFPNNGCYVSRQPGTVIVDGGLLMNNNVSAVRVSGGVEVHGTTVYIDVDRYVDGPGNIRDEAHNTRGFWGDNRQAGTDGGLVTGASVILKSYQRCTGLASILENPKMSVRNCQFLLDTDIDCIQADRGEIEVVDCRFDGQSAGSTAGIGDITGPGGFIAPNIDPGAVPVKGRDPSFMWTRTHPRTPDRPDQNYPPFTCPSIPCPPSSAARRSRWNSSYE